MDQWIQNYNPLHYRALSTAVAAIPVCLLLFLLAVRRMLAHKAAVYALAAAVVLSAAVFRMPVYMVTMAVADGLVYAVFRIAWVLLCAVFVYEVTVETGHFEIIKKSIGGVTDDRRLQILLIAFAFGALLEGSGGGGAPVAVCGAMMAGLGFDPFAAAVLCLIANTAPVAFGGVGNPIRVLVAVTGLPEADLSAMAGRILTWAALILPFWLVRTAAKTRDTIAVWPALLVCGVTFGGVQLYWSNYRDAALVDIIGGIVTMLVLTFFFKVWRPREIWRYPGEAAVDDLDRHHYTSLEILHAWTPFLLLAVFVILWGVPSVKSVLGMFSNRFPVPGLDMKALRVPPVVAEAHAEPAVFEFEWMASIGTATFLAGFFGGAILGLSIGQIMRVFLRTCVRMRYSMVAILAMISIGFITRYSGMDAVMGLAMASTGALFTFFGTLLGWLGVALTGTDAGSNALFGSLQVITANKLSLSPVLMAAANSAGGVMGKMIDAQSIVVACAATGQEGKEGDLFRAVFKHSVALAAIIGLIVTAYAYLFPGWVPSGRLFR
ncbi:MAG TPA: L-lactate permease [Bryobacterales bacterium]|nr:L-lactate permease [Bryobacterales bacterium]